MATIEGTLSNFEGLSKEGITIIDFWAEWCGPCKRFGPIFEKASESHPDVKFVKVDVDAQPELSAGANIKSIPTIFAIKDGRLVFSESGILNPSQLDNLVSQLKELDTSTISA